MEPEALSKRHRQRSLRCGWKAIPQWLGIVL
jgi:hypothetical protein